MILVMGRTSVMVLLTGCLSASVILVGFARSNQLSHKPEQSNHTYRVDVNSASAEELRLLPGIGGSVAQHIVDYRDQHGPFEDLEQLDNVPMIGQITLQRISPWIEIRQHGSETP